MRVRVLQGVKVQAAQVFSSVHAFMVGRRLQAAVGWGNRRKLQGVGRRPVVPVLLTRVLPASSCQVWGVALGPISAFPGPVPL